MPEAVATPLATVAVATFNAAAHVAQAIASARAQTLAAIEIVIVDDASTDRTCAIVGEAMRSDPRIRLERLSVNSGPAEARNLALRVARGRWFAVFDSDDLLAPDRLERLIATAEADAADIIADDMIVFEDGDRPGARFFLPRGHHDRWITPEAYLRGARMLSSGIDYGYLKPVIRLDALRARGLAYDPALRIAEDDDLVVRMLLAGMRYRLDPSAGYGYRRHASSTSHRLSARNAEAIVTAGARLCAANRGHEFVALLRRRQTGFVRAHNFARLIEALRSRDFAAAATVAAADPPMLVLLRHPIGAMLRRLTGTAGRGPQDDPQAREVLAAMLPQ